MDYTVVTYNEVDYHSFEKAVKLHFGEKYKDYEYAPYEETSNGDNRIFRVDGKLNDYRLKDIEDGCKHYMAGVLLDKMCADGVIPPGQYLIECS